MKNEKCELCLKNDGIRISYEDNLLGPHVGVLYVCTTCLMKEINEFADKLGADNDSEYSMEHFSPHELLEKDFYLKQKIINIIRIKIFQNKP